MRKRGDKRSEGVVDDLIERYVAWREECRRVESAYRRWGLARPAERMLAFAAYVAAIDGEDRAAADYRVLIDGAADFAR